MYYSNKSRGTGISGGKTRNDSIPKMFSKSIENKEKKEKNIETLNLARLLDWSKGVDFSQESKKWYRGKFHNRK